MITCPISKQIMTDPVNCDDGNTYERSVIIEKLNESYRNTGQYLSPLKNTPMRIDNMNPNNLIKELINSYNSSNGLSITLNSHNFKDYSKKNIKIDSNLYYIINDFTGAGLNPFCITNDDLKLHISIKPNIIPTQQRTAIIFVIDVSGSMDDNVSTENYSLTKLDLVKHSVKTLINLMNSLHDVCVITFNDRINLIQSFINMTEDNKNKVISKIDGLRSGGSTNIWGGLELALKEIYNLKEDNINVNIALLTDGIPNINPSKGLIPTMISKMNELDIKHSYTISTFGFGYDIDSKLLNLISKHGSGSYGYIPDSSMVGTVFVNWVSNILSTYITNSKLIVKNEKGNVLINNHTIGPIIFDQTRDILFNLNSKNFKFLKIEIIVNNEKIFETELSSVNVNDNSNNILSHIIRNNIISTVNDAIEDVNKVKFVHELYNKINKCIVNNSSNIPYTEMEYIKSFFYDYEPTYQLRDLYKGGQIKEAFSNITYLDKWGRHYLRSLMNAYNFQQCNNFKDPGVQVFAGNFFNQFRDKAEDIFNSIPLPTGTGGYVNARDYMNSSVPCFKGNALIKTMSGYVEAQNIVKGDIVVTSNGNKSKVVCTVKTKVKPDERFACLINNTYVTPYHPVILKGKNEWKFPIDIKKDVIMIPDMEYVYNFVLDEGHIIEFDCGLISCTMGHNFNDNSVITHPYFGSNKIINDLMLCSGWNEGNIVFEDIKVSRENGYIVKISE